MRISSTTVLAVLSLAMFGCDLIGGHEGPSPEDFSLTSATVPPGGGACDGGACAKGEGDGAKDGSETDVDCGGPTAPACADGKACAVAADCASGVCAGGACAAPTATDGVKNGDETDVDCGGASAPACAPGKACKAGTDCNVGTCAVGGTCAIARSCDGRLGAGDHCGPNANESCCASARVPDVGDGVDYSVAKWGLDAHVSAFRLDKYEVTVGRMRAFFEAMGGNPQASFEATMGPGAGANPHVPGSGWSSAWNKRLPSSWDEIDSRYGDPAVNTKGTQYCMRGAFGDYGTSTWKPAADTNPKLEDNVEVKPLVCVDWYTLFAFCAWDGGRLPTSIEWGLAAGDDLGNAYAWGNDAPSFDVVVTALNGFAPFPDFTWGDTIRTPGDRGTHIAPAGRKAVTRFGLYDLAGNAAEWLLDAHVPHGACSDCADVSGWSDPQLAWPNPEPTLGAGDPTWADGGYRVVRGGSWEGHDTHNVDGTWDGVEVGFTYHALGGRCARGL